MSYIANEGYILQTLPGQGTAKIISPPSSNVKANGQGCYSGTISISISNYSGGPSVAAQGTGVGTLDGTGNNVLIDGKPAVLLNDQTTITVSGVNGSGVPASESVTVIVSNAGQTMFNHL